MQWAKTAVLAVAVCAPANAERDACSLRAFAASSADLAVHSKPSAASPVLKKVPAEFAELELREQRGSWFRIAFIENAESGESLFVGSGWVRGSALALGISGGNRFLYAEPREGSRQILVGQTGGENTELVGCAGPWARVRLGAHTGWLAPGAQCSSALTTCN